MTRPDPSSSLHLARLAAAAALLCACAAHAETSPWYVGARETVTRDTNVFRTTDALSDTIFSTGLFGGLDEQIGRQRLRANLAANWNRYRNVDQLNHTDGQAGLRLDWETIDHLSGDLQVNHNRSLYRDFSLATNAQQKVIVNATDAAFNARLGVVTAWTLEAGIFGSRTRFDAPLQASDINYDGYRAGARYAPSSISSIGLAYRRTKGKYPNSANTGDFDRDDVDLLLNWEPTGTSTFAGRVSRTKIDYPNLGTHSNSLTTGELTYRWNPGSRLSLDASLVRDSNAGQAVSDFGVGGLVVGSQQSADTRVATTTGLAAHYDLTGKIKLGLDLRHVDRKLDTTVTDTFLGQTSVTPHSANDRTDSVGLNAVYDATRALQFSCGVTHIKRSVGGPDAAVLTYPYSVNLTSCSAQFALQP